MARRDRRRAETTALAVSVLAHLVIFIVLAHQAAPGLRAPAEVDPDFQIQLVNTPPPAAAAAETTPTPPRLRRPTPRETPRAPPRPVERARNAPTLPARAVQAARPPAPHTPPAPPSQLSRPTANGPAAGTQGGAGPGASGPGSASRWSVQGQDEGDEGVRKVLRATVGCSHEDFAQLRPDERAECDRRAGKEARLFNQQLDAMDPQKRAGFIAAAQAQDRARADRTGPLKDVFTPCQGNANLGGGCVNTPFRHGSGGP